MTLGDRIVVMSKGLIQQAGTPLDVYKDPANRFVAGFVGTPPMNFLDGTLVQGPGGLAFDEGSNDADGHRYLLPLTPRQRDALAEFAGKPITLGIRPSALREVDVARAPQGTAFMKLPVRVVEPLGDSMDVYCNTPKHPHLVARVPAHSSLKAGSLAAFTVLMEEVHAFEPGEFGRSLLRPR